MCTAEETRVIMKEENPAWVKWVLSAAMSALLAIAGYGLLLNIAQEKTISNLAGTISTSYATLAGSIAVLTNQVNNVKELSVLEAISRNKLIDERCLQMSNRIDNLERMIERAHTPNIR